MKINKNFLLCLMFLVPITGNAAINILTNNNGGAGRLITSSSGTAVVTGSIRIGYFLDIVASNSVMRGDDFAALNQVFIPLGENSAIPERGDVTTPGVAGNLPIPIGATAGKFSGEITGITNVGIPTGTRIFMLISNSSDPKTSAPTEWALVSDAAWSAPFNDPNLGGTGSLSLNTTNINDSNADVWRGSFAATTGNPLKLAAVPEVTSSILISSIGLLSLLRRRR